jgi:hypothetical protein
MKKYITIFIAFFISSQGAYSQDEQSSVLDNNKWTLRTFAIGKPYTFETQTAVPNLFSGLGLKYNFKNISLRVSYENNPYGYRDAFQSLVYKEQVIRLGTEYRRIYEGRVSLNLFIDVAYMDFSQDFGVTDSLATPISLTKIRGNGYGAIIGIGVDYFLTPQISICLESRLDILVYRPKYEKTLYVTNTTTQFEQRFTQTNLGIIGNFGINYHF